jgi:hypothetical protein
MKMRQKRAAKTSPPMAAQNVHAMNLARRAINLADGSASA